jgi:hypothetical protein
MKISLAADRRRFSFILIWKALAGLHFELAGWRLSPETMVHASRAGHGAERRL